MSRDDDDPFAPPKKAPEHVVGQPLHDLSIEELGLRIATLKAEIARLEAAQAAKEASLAGAAAFFKSAR
ncbi:MAG: DUF1192 domain-containing protein [Methylovirgula sp.]|nr:DUF1192 domain-containing protein [Methylovirgula sp.]